jgi:hypothetical protein
MEEAHHSEAQPSNSPSFTLDLASQPKKYNGGKPQKHTFKRVES